MRGRPGANHRSVPLRSLTTLVSLAPSPFSPRTSMQPSSRHHSSNYDKYPFIPVGSPDDCAVGWEEVARVLASRHKAGILCIECYPGVTLIEIDQSLQRYLRPKAIIRASDGYKSPAAVEAMLRPLVGDDRVFARMNNLEIADYFDLALLAQHQHSALAAT